MPLSATLAPYYLLPAAAAFAVTAVGTYYLIPRLIRSGVVGYDVHKANRPVVAEMGGIAIFAGLVAGISSSIAVATFFQPLFIRIPLVTAALATIGIIAVIGIADDIITIRQRYKAILPVFSALPLIAIAVGDPSIFIPGIGPVNLGLLYPLLIVPLAVTGAANAVNMLAGWNGVEVGMGAIMFGALAVYGAMASNHTLLAIALPGLMACVAFLAFNWYPAKVFPGDVGCLVIGGAFATAVIIGNVEFLGLILMVPYLMDLAMKLRHRLPKTHAIYEGGKLVSPPNQPPMGLGHLFLRISGGMTEKTLVVSLLAFEAAFALLGLGILFWMLEF